MQGALQHALLETGVAGTGPLDLPPPASISDTHSLSEVPGDAGTYSNTLTAQLYRDADGKVWTQPGPGHDTPNLQLTLREQNGEYKAVMELTKIIGVVRRGTRVRTTIRTEDIGSSGARSSATIESDQGHGWDEVGPDGAPIRSSTVRNEERFHQFSPHDIRTAIRQAIWVMQSHKSLYAFEQPDPAVGAGADLTTTAGLTVAGGVLATAVLVAAGVAIALAMNGLGQGAGSPSTGSQSPSQPSIDASSPPGSSVPGPTRVLLPSTSATLREQVHHTGANCGSTDLVVLVQITGEQWVGKPAVLRITGSGGGDIAFTIPAGGQYTTPFTETGCGSWNFAVVSVAGLQIPQPSP